MSFGLHIVKKYSELNHEKKTFSIHISFTCSQRMTLESESDHVNYADLNLSRHKDRDLTPCIKDFPVHAEERTHSASRQLGYGRKDLDLAERLPSSAGNSLITSSLGNLVFGSLKHDSPSKTVQKASSDCLFSAFKSRVWSAGLSACMMEMIGHIYSHDALPMTPGNVSGPAESSKYMSGATKGVHVGVRRAPPVF